MGMYGAVLVHPWAHVVRQGCTYHPQADRGTIRHRISRESTQAKRACMCWIRQRKQREGTPHDDAVQLLGRVPAGGRMQMLVQLAHGHRVQRPRAQQQRALRAQPRTPLRKRICIILTFAPPPQLTNCCLHLAQSERCNNPIALLSLEAANSCPAPKGVVASGHPPFLQSGLHVTSDARMGMSCHKGYWHDEDNLALLYMPAAPRASERL